MVESWNERSNLSRKKIMRAKRGQKRKLQKNKETIHVYVYIVYPDRSERGSKSPERVISRGTVQV